MLLLTVLKVLSLTYTVAAASDTTILVAILDSLDKLLARVSSAPANRNLLFGIAIAKGELGIAKKLLPPQSQVVSRIKYLENASSKILLSKRSVADGAQDPMNVLFRDKVWSLGRPMRQLLCHKPLTSECSGVELEYGSPNQSQSDACIRQVVTCRVSKKCHQLEMDDHNAGYPLAHQALFFSLALKLRCEIRNPIEIFMNVVAHLAKKCCRMYSESVTIARMEFPPHLQDLFTEQVAVCGLANYEQFLTLSNLNTIIRFQRLSGCFGPIDWKTGRYVGNCSAHMSGVSAAALAIFVKKLVMDFDPCRRSQKLLANTHQTDELIKKGVNK